MAWYNRGIALHELKRYEDALASFDRAIALDSDGDAAIAGRTRSLKALGRTREALESANRAIAAPQGFPRASLRPWTCAQGARANRRGALGVRAGACARPGLPPCAHESCRPSYRKRGSRSGPSRPAARALSARNRRIKEPVPRLLVVASRPPIGPPRSATCSSAQSRKPWNRPRVFATGRGRGPDLRSCLRSDRRPRRCGMAAGSPGGRALRSAGHSGNCKEPFTARPPDIGARPERLARAILDDGPHGTARDGVGRPFSDGGSVSAPSRCAGILLRARTAVLRERVRLHRIAGRNHACSHARRRTRPRAIIRQSRSASMAGGHRRIFIPRLAARGSGAARKSVA